MAEFDDGVTRGGGGGEGQRQVWVGDARQECFFAALFPAIIVTTVRFRAYSPSLALNC